MGGSGMSRKDDYGPYGTGLDGYVHYRQAMDESKQAVHRYNKPEQVPRSYDKPTRPKSQNIFYGVIVCVLIVVFCLIFGAFFC